MTQLPAIPSAHHVAVAIVAACHATGEDPIECASGTPKMRGRFYAFAALRSRFPNTHSAALARMVGVSNPSSAKTFWTYVRQSAGNSRWWDESIVTRIREAVAPPALVSETEEIGNSPEQASETVGGAGRTAAPDNAENGPLKAVRVSAAIRTPDRPGVTFPVPVGEKPAPPSSSGRTFVHEVPIAPTAPRTRPATSAAIGGVMSGGAVGACMRPDAPAANRGVEIVTAQLMGDPPPGRSALARFDAGGSYGARHSGPARRPVSLAHGASPQPAVGDEVLDDDAEAAA